LKTPFIERKKSKIKSTWNEQNGLGGLITSGESAKESEVVACRLRVRILALALRAGANGLTISEAERLIDDHKGHSVSPRFAELVRIGALVRVPIEPGRPTKRFPHGIPRYARRKDEQTGRTVNIHWLPEFVQLREDSVERNHGAIHTNLVELQGGQL
jgi:hypothetical protein